MLSGHLHPHFTGPRGAARDVRQAILERRFLCGDVLYAALPDLDTQVHREGSASFTARLRHPDVELDFQAAAAALRRSGLLTALLHELGQMTPFGRPLTSLGAPELHALYHDDLLDAAADAHGVERDLMDETEYVQTLLELGLPVLLDDSYDPSLHALSDDPGWPTARPPGCPGWLWTAGASAVRLARTARPRQAVFECPLLFPRVLLTCDDRLPELFDELRHCGADHVPARTVRRLLRLQPAADATWAALHALEREARCRGGTP